MGICWNKGLYTNIHKRIFSVRFVMYTALIKLLHPILYQILLTLFLDCYAKYVHNIKNCSSFQSIKPYFNEIKKMNKICSQNKRHKAVLPSI